MAFPNNDVSLGETNDVLPNRYPSVGMKSNKSYKSVTKTCSFDTREDKEKQFNRFLRFYSDRYSPEQLKDFFKNGVLPNGYRMMTTNNSTWLYDYYKITKSSIPHVKELTDNTTIDYNYYITPFNTQIGNINLVMMHSQVNFEDGTFTPSDRFYKINKVTPEMIEKANIKSNEIKNSL